MLPGGLRVVTQFVPGVQSASVGLWVQVGSRDEVPSLAGAAHFLEHLLFKSTPTRTATSIAQQIDAIGGELNAFTGKEHTCYYAHVLDENVDEAIDLVADVVLRGRCLSGDMEIERDVVLEEIAMRDDDPEDLLGEAFLASMYGAHSLGRPVIGSTESIAAMARRQLHSFHVRRYTPDRMVLAVAGNVDHRAIVAAARAAFAGHLQPGTAPVAARPGTAKVPGKPGFSLLRQETEQAHLTLGVRTAGRAEPDRWAVSVLNTALGGGLSSRLFQEIRETRGLAYSVYSSVDAFAETGALSVYAGCSPERLAEVVDLATTILTDVAENGLTAAEFDRAKGALRGNVVLGLEDSSSRMHRIGQSELNYGRHRTVAQSLRQLDRVRRSDVNALAARLLTGPFGGAVVGPYRNRRQLPKQLAALGAVR